MLLVAMSVNILKAPRRLDFPEPFGPMSTVTGPISVSLTSRSERNPWMWLERAERRPEAGRSPGLD
jgi:hypothetical protein